MGFGGFSFGVSGFDGRSHAGYGFALSVSEFGDQRFKGGLSCALVLQVRVGRSRTL